MKFMIAFVVIIFSSVRSAPVQEQGCDVESFKKSVLSTSLLPGNEIVCPSNGGKMKANQFCQHIYKCPLDLTDKVRHCEAVCRENGTWAYQYPTCSDMLPLAEYLRAQVTLNVEMDKQEERNPAEKHFRSAESIMTALQENDNDTEDEEDLTKPQAEPDTEEAKPDTTILSRVRRWSFYKPPPRKMPEATTTTTTEAPTTTTAAITKESHNDTDFSWVEQYCGPRICSIANSLGCHVITLLKLHPDYEIQTSLCRICMMMDYCPTNMGIFGTSV